jgi:predicted transport protein
MQHIKLKTISLRNHPILNERWLQNVIADDPSVLGLGDVIVKDKERIHRGLGRLDLLLQDEDGHGRYEVEIQLGSTDESHIIRTLEYWDIERRKYPQYDHVGVIIAEDITSRFLNVISLFNGFIPLMAIQVTAIDTPEGIGLQFTKVLDTVRLGYLEEDEGTAEPTDRVFWETKRGTKQTVAFADKLCEIARSFAPSAQLNYNKHYIGFTIEGRSLNFAVLRPRKSALNVDIRLPRTDEQDKALADSNLDILEYDKRWGAYRIKLSEKDIKEQKDLIAQLLQMALDVRKNG